MPSGTYSFHDPHDGTALGEERFSCAPGPLGWRYTGSGIDLTLDARGRPLRLQAQAGGWRVRGGATLVDGTSGVVWLRTAVDPTLDVAGVEHEAKAAGFTGRSPAFLIATATMLDLSPGGSARLRLISLTEPVLAAHTVDQSWTLVAVESHDGLAVERYHVDDLATGERAVLHVSGDVVLAAPGIELEALDTPPNARITTAG
ncbi:hypothetical protein [Streptomyces sp. SID3343]|uniref:hypothetical protein n=1 Tax=Streptomyces sp. SID3343 TaxID=2690260 RepID=UPI00136EA5AD|nr:hypothetical protein [Streptomyces sp. SID3343]MYV97663.1 hypothetical protein [Streptomyces sp. SID3343]